MHKLLENAKGWGFRPHIQDYLPFPDSGALDRTASPKLAEKADQHLMTESPVPLGFPRHRWLLLFGDVMLIWVAVALSIGFRISFSWRTLSDYSLEPAFTLIMYPLTLYIFDLYNIQRVFRSWETSLRSAVAVGLGTLLVVLVFYMAPVGPYGRGVMALEAILAWYFLNVWRFLYGILFQKSGQRKPVLIIGAGSCGKRICKLLKSPLSPYEIRGFIDDNPVPIDTTEDPAIVGGTGQIVDITGKAAVDTVILAIPRNRPEHLVHSILEARLKGIQVLDMADVYETLTGRIPIGSIGDQWLLFTHGFYLLRADYIQKLKRLTDFIASGLILLAMSPIIGLTFLAIRLESPGPVFYTQQRVGKDRKLFTIYKFRSMRFQAEESGAQWAKEKDPRVTRVGRILRLTHIDEIPQIWNIFKGEMSLVGPRPERPEFVDVLEKQLPYYFVRHTVRPGLTGWAQINYRYGASVEDAHNKLEYDLYYVKNMSLFLDLMILLRTIGVVLLKDGSR